MIVRERTGNQTQGTARTSVRSEDDKARHGASPTPGPQRIGWVDDARGIGIILVVVGHALPGLRNAGILSDSLGLRFLEHWIYAFHMPLFFFLSGLFVSKSGGEPLTAFVASKLRTVAYPYVVWSVLQTVMQSALGGMTNRQTALTSLLTIVYLPIMQFWFLYTLFLIFTLVAVLEKAGVRPAGIFACACALYLSPAFVSLGSWGVPYSVANHMIYFATGLLVAGAIHSWMASLAQRHAGVVMFAGFGGVALCVALELQRAIWAKPFIALMGTAAVLVLGAQLDRMGRWRFLNSWGRSSLQIYVAHTMASAGFRIVLQRGLGVVAPLPHIVGGIATGLLVPLALNWACERVGFRYAFSWPKASVARRTGDRPAAPSGPVRASAAAPQRSADQR